MPGASKLLRPWKQGTVLGSVLSAADDAGLDPLVVVLGSAAKEAMRGLEEDRMVVVRHDRWEAGRASSLAAGLQRCPPDRPVVVLLGDEPGIAADAIRAVLGAWRECAPDLVRARYADRPGHPVLLGPAALAAARDLEGEESVWLRLVRSGMSGLEVPIDGPAPIDVDRPSDLEAARARLSRDADSMPGRSSGPG